MYKYELPVFQGANLLIQLTGAYSRYGTFRFTMNWIAKVYRANLAKGYHSTNFLSCNQQKILPPDPMPGAVQFEDPNFPDHAVNLDFSGLDTANVLNDPDFDPDFDAFLNTDDGSNWQLGEDLTSNLFDEFSPSR
jgi:hypothetical protein